MVQTESTEFGLNRFDRERGLNRISFLAVRPVKTGRPDGFTIKKNRFDRTALICAYAAPLWTIECDKGTVYMYSKVDSFLCDERFLWQKKKNKYESEWTVSSVVPGPSRFSHRLHGLLIGPFYRENRRAGTKNEGRLEFKKSTLAIYSLYA